MCEEVLMTSLPLTPLRLLSVCHLQYEIHHCRILPTKSVALCPTKRWRGTWECDLPPSTLPLRVVFQLACERWDVPARLVLWLHLSAIQEANFAPNEPAAHAHEARCIRKTLVVQFCDSFINHIKAISVFEKPLAVGVVLAHAVSSTNLLSSLFFFSLSLQTRSLYSLANLRSQSSQLVPFLLSLLKLQALFSVRSRRCRMNNRF